MNHEKKEQERFDFLKLIYDLSDGNPSRLIPWRGRGKNLGFDGEKIAEILKYLYEEKLVKLESKDNITITDKGADEVGRKLTNPQNPTEHFGEMVKVDVDND